MKRLVLGLLAAAAIHLLVLLFGGIFFLGSKDPNRSVAVKDVEVLDPVEEKKEDEKDDNKQEELEKRKAADLDVPQDKPPDMRQLVELEQERVPVADATPKLEALSLGALESMLAPGAAGSGEFGLNFGLASGGRIGGTGEVGAQDPEAGDLAFGLEELDQKARPLVQTAPAYPVELRQRKIEGVVTVMLLVDAAGRVMEPKVERSSDPRFEPAALEAVRRWKFEPARRNGQKVPSKLRVPIRFSVGS